MNHTVNNVTQLYADAKALYDNGVKASADSIIEKLNSSIENLKTNWKGKDAGVQINNIVMVNNALINIRNVLGQLAVDSSKIAVNYREIQNANGAKLETLGAISCETKSNITYDPDTEDRVYITEDARNGKNSLDAALGDMPEFINKIEGSYSAIMDNWTKGTGRDEAVNAFTEFKSKVGEYQNTLQEVSDSITQALANYGG